MRLFAEEERAGTLETLLTAPVRTWQLVLGKYFATLSFYLILWIPAFIQFQLFSVLTNVPVPFSAGSLMGAFLLVFLMGALYIAIGCFASSLTSSQIIAGVVTIGLLVIHYFLGYVTLIYGDRFPAAPLFHYVSANEHLRYFSQGLIDSRPIIYYLSAAAFFLFLTSHVINHRRWRS
jgi:ABC-2 type transport system permease protein